MPPSRLLLHGGALALLGQGHNPVIATDLADTTDPNDNLNQYHRRPVKVFNINLDSDPEHRFDEVTAHFNATMWAFVEKMMFGPSVEQKAIKKVLYKVVEKRGEENAEQQKEIEGIARVSKVDVRAMHALQMLYELDTLMPPVRRGNGNETSTSPLDSIPVDSPFAFIKDLKYLSDIGFRGPGCMGIIAKATRDESTVWHARNLDFGGKLMKWAESHRL